MKTPFVRPFPSWRFRERWVPVQLTLRTSASCRVTGVIKNGHSQGFWFFTWKNKQTNPCSEKMNSYLTFALVFVNRFLMVLFMVTCIPLFPPLPSAPSTLATVNHELYPAGYSQSTVNWPLFTLWGHTPAVVISQVKVFEPAGWSGSFCVFPVSYFPVLVWVAVRPDQVN